MILYLFLVRYRYATGTPLNRLHHYLPQVYVIAIVFCHCGALQHYHSNYAAVPFNLLPVPNIDQDDGIRYRPFCCSMPGFPMPVPHLRHFPTLPGLPLFPTAAALPGYRH